MTDTEPIIRDELERLAPEAENATPDLADVRRRANLGGESRSRRTLRRVIVVAAVALALAAPTLAFSGSVRDLLGLERPKPVVEQAMLLLSAPVGNGFWAHGFTAPSSTGGRCDFFVLNRSAQVAPASDPNGAMACSSVDPDRRLTRARPDYPLNVGFSISRRLKGGDPAKWVPPTVSGAVLPRLHVARVEVRWTGGSLPLRLKENFFLGGSPDLYMPSFDRFPFVVAAYDRTGAKVAEKRLPSPALMMMNGWKEYTAAYKRWQRIHEGG
ncbi:MAG: hypothetical protein WKF41_14060 [Gaiellaceae bacterium]